MSTAIQRRRGTAAQHASFTGLPGEITIDTTDNRAVVHDGSTAGGHPMAKESEVGIGATVGATEKTTPVDADIFGIADSADSNALKKVSFSNMAAYVAGKLGAAIAALTGKTTPVDADVLLLSDSAASSASKKLTWANLVTGVGAGLGAAIVALTAKTTPVSADTLLLSDSAATNASKKITWANIVAGMITDLGASIAGLTAKSTPVDADTFLLSDSAASNASKKVTVAALKSGMGLGSADSPQFTGVNVGHASDTTVTRGAAGFLAVEGKRVPSPASQAAGDILYRGSTEWERLAKGTAGQVLVMNAGATAPEWASSATGGIASLGTTNTTSGTTVTASGLTLTSYKFLTVILNAISTSSLGSIMQNSVAVGTIASTQIRTVTGMIRIDLTTGIGMCVTSDDNGANSVTKGYATGMSTASTSFSLSASAGSFDAGSFTLYGEA